MLQGVIFDLDGTLIDSEPIWEQVLRSFVERYGKVFDPTFHKTILGTERLRALRSLVSRFELPVSAEELVPLYDPAFSALAIKTPPPAKAGAQALLDRLRALGVPLALATGSRHEIVDPILKAHGWDQVFQTVVCGDDVPNGKPAPDTYARAVQALGCAKDHCVALEDGVNGVESAKSAGLKVIGVVDPRFGADLSAADCVVGSLEEVTIEDLREIAS